MFWNLWKYEIKCSYRSYALMYGILLLAALLISPNNNFMTGIITLIYGVMIVVIMVMTIVLIVRNYQISMFQRPGYLTLTLPVSSKKLMLVKILNASIWFILSYVVIFLSALLLGARISGASMGEIFDAIGMVINSFNMEAFLILANLTVSLVSSVVMIYAILNFTHSCYVRKHRVIIGIVIFVTINILLSYVAGALFGDSGLQNGLFVFISGSTSSANSVFHAEQQVLISIVENIVVMLLSYFGACYLLDHKLEME